MLRDFLAYLKSPLSWSWDTSDKLTAIGLLITIGAGVYAVYSRRKGKSESRIENAPNLMVSFCREPSQDELYGGAMSASVIPTLDNIGKSTAREISCEYLPWNEISDSPATFILSTANVQYLKPGEKLDLVKHRSVQIRWDTKNRGYEDLPYAIFMYIVIYSDNTHQYLNTFCVSLFGFPDQIRDDTDNDFTVELVRQASVSLSSIRRRERIDSMKESIARPIRKRRYARVLKKQEALKLRSEESAVVQEQPTNREPDAV